MKAKKVLKRIAKIEELISKVTERSSASSPIIRELLRHAKAAVIRAKKAVSLEASSGTLKNPAKRPSKTTPEPFKPKRKLSAAGRKAISEATKKRWAAKRAAAAKAAPSVAKKTAVKKSAAKKAIPVKAAKAPARKVAKKAPVKKAAVKAPAKEAVRVVQAAKTPAQATNDEAAVNTPEQTAPEAPVHEAGETEASQ